ncbi:hypothetical protein PC9H_000158 [Pleurotus ostreatus]|uniref:Myb-like domain-containing protein n=1 Tax=Pleurotus ostreatus TaxID=5322 RepID=A0A8H7DWD1_PLEOS|nr:uncharacterized protein PC9H_000158 [Pleurotus ostreatus]KAF7439822.1 hypothetical protein PC9H_000158 [Pleurotus ostreatus]KAJ8701004.1 hypothetical protein PTI98_003973 [Pleurotus ostreatus]
MDKTCAETHAALQRFIASQKAFLERTQSDIDRLKRLKAEAAVDPDRFCSNISNNLNDSAYKLSKRLEGWTDPPDVDWDTFVGCDPSALKALGSDARSSYANRNQPHTSQRSELSELQKLVKRAKCQILDPVVDKLTSQGCFDRDEDDEIDMEEMKREIERERMMRLKKKKIRCGGLTISISARVPTDVVVRKDLEDESGDVEISIGDDRKACDPASSLQSAVDDIPSISHTSSAPPFVTSSSNIVKATRVRRAPARTQEQDAGLNDTRPLKKAKLKAEPEEPLTIAPTTAANTKRSRDASRPKSETYKQAWSTSEQHLLEKLLEDIPDGEKNRWQKISQAMDGRRTPRQVASRVQKYFEKLKRFGVGLNGS